MARGNFMQTSFLGGEWSPFSQGKTDERDYYTGLNLALNFLPTDEGALVRRSGTRFSAHAKNSTGLIRLVPFISESSDALLVEMTDRLLRFHARGTLFSSTLVDVTAITAATPGVVTTATAHGLSNGDTVIFVSPDTPFPVAIRNRQYTVANVTTLTFEIKDTLPVGIGDADGTALNGIFASAAISVAKVEERVVPHQGSQLSAVKYTEEEDTLYLFHPEHEINTVSRTDLTVAELDLIDGPYLDENETTTTLGFSAVTGSGVTVTASAATGINSGQGFLETDIGRLIRVNSGTAIAPAWTYLTITAHTSATVVTATVSGPDLAATTAVTTWRLGLFSDTTGHPTHGVVHEGRLFLISNVSAGRVDGSRSPGVAGSRFADFTPTAADGTVADDNAVSAIFAGAGRKNGKWLQSVGNGLIVGTDGGEDIVRASSFDDPLSPFSIQVRRHTTFGSADQLPVRAGRTSLFVQELGRSLFEYKDAGGGQYDGNDVSRTGRHLTTDGITELAYQKIPNPVVWCLRGDKRLIGCTFRDDVEGRQVAWHRHSIEYARDTTLGEDAEDRFLQGGRSNSDALAHSIATLPFSDPEGSRNDNLWVAVDREGTTCIEYLTPVFDISFAQNEGFFVDSGNIYYQGDLNVNWEVVSSAGGNSTVRFFGLDRLNGKTVDGMFRGLDIGTGTVANGQIDFTIEDGLLTTAGAIELVAADFITTANFTFTSAVDSTDNQSDPSPIGSPCSQSPVITGEDGKRYYVYGGTSGASGDGGNMIIYDADAGTEAFNKTSATIKTEAAAAGVEPTGGDITDNAASSVAAFTIPDTPYIVVIVGSAGGLSAAKRIVYYRITSAGTLVVDGGYAGKTDGLDVQFSPVQEGGSAIYAAGHVMSSPRTGVNETIAYRYPIAVAYHGEGRSSLMVLPSINFILSNTPTTEAGSTPWRNREIDLDSDVGFGANILNLTDSPNGAATRSRGFFLPRKSGRGSHFAMMFYVKDLEAFDAGTETTANTFLDANATANVTGLISSVRISTTAVPVGTDAFGHTPTVGAITVNRDADFDVFPFPDDKEDFAGNAGTATDNYYLNPTVLPFDVNDESKPWLLFFPRLYKESGDTDKFGIRIYQWDPIREVATFLSFLNGQMYTLGVDVDANVIPSHAAISWNRDTGELTALIQSFSTGEKDWIVAKFGTFNPVLGTTSVVDERHVDGVIGCNYRSRAQLLRPDIGAGAQNGPGLAKLRRIDQYGMLTFKTGATFIGTTFVEADMFDVNFENLAGADVYGRNPLFSQVAHGSLQSGYDFDNLVTWEVRRPVPGAYVSIAGFSNTSDR